MTYWEWIFRQSRVNHGAYDGDRLPIQIWDWPRGTWFQERLQYLRDSHAGYSRGLTEETLPQIHR